MPGKAVHKSQQKKGKSRSASGAQYEYARRLQAFDENEDIPIGRITKIENARSRVVITFYDSEKKQVVEVRASIPDKNIERLGPNVGSYIVPVQSGKNWEVFLILSDEDARRRSDRIHHKIQSVSFGGGTIAEVDCGIEFVAEDDEAKPQEEEEKKNKKDKVSKHKDRVLRDEHDGDDDDVDVDNI